MRQVQRSHSRGSFRGFWENKLNRKSAKANLHHRPKRIILAPLGSWIAFAFLNSKLIDQPMQISTRNAQRSRAFRFAPAAFAQCAQDQRALEAPHFIFVRPAEI